MPKSGTLTKAHIFDAVAEANEFTRQKSIETVEILLELIKSTLESGDDVMISGFGRFCVKQKAERRGRNPATGKDMILKPRKVVTFKSSGKLKGKINVYLPANQKSVELSRKENLMPISKKDLQALQKDIKALEKRMEKLITAAQKNEKAKATKKAPAKKAPLKKKTAQPTATDQVLRIINRSKKGVNIATLMTKTGFNQKKISNIIQKTYKQGKIARVGKGIYTRA
jgi:integration host factor subunit alpha